MNPHACPPLAPRDAYEVIAERNRPGLSAVVYRIGTFSAFRETMLHAISGTPELSALRTRYSDDFAITVLELWAALADVLTFYQERIANEAFLRTATTRDAVQRLARLLGYRLSPGVAAETWLSFTATGPEPVQVPAHSRVQSVPGQDEQPQVFETLEAVSARAWLSDLPGWPAPVGVNPLARGARSAFLAPAPDGLAAAAALTPGDRVIVFNAEGADLEDDPDALDTASLILVYPLDTTGTTSGTDSAGALAVNPPLMVYPLDTDGTDPAGTLVANPLIALYPMDTAGTDPAGTFMAEPLITVYPLDTAGGSDAAATIAASGLQFFYDAGFQLYFYDPAQAAGGSGGGDTGSDDAAAEDGSAEATPAPPRYEVLTVREVQVQGEQARLHWEAPVREASWHHGTQAYRLGRILRPFGHDAPETYTKPVQPGEGDNTAVNWVQWRQGTLKTGPDATAPETTYGVASGTTLALDHVDEDIVAGARLLLVEGGGQCTPLVVSAVSEVTAELGQRQDTVTALTFTSAFGDIEDRRRVRIFELQGPPVAFWGYDYPAQLSEPVLHVPGLRLAADAIEILRPVERMALEPGQPVTLPELPQGRTVLLDGDGAEPAPLTLLDGNLVGLEVTCTNTPDDAATVARLGLDAEQAEALAGLASAPLDDEPGFSAAQPALTVTVGELGPFELALTDKPATRKALRDDLQRALRAAHDHDAFARAQVVLREKRLVVLAGTPERAVRFAPTATDETTVVEAGLDEARARAVTALRSAPLPADLGVFGTPARLRVTIGPVGPRELDFAVADGAAKQADALQTALRAADPAPSFARAHVVLHEGRLLIVPGPLGQAPQHFLRLRLGGPLPEAPAAPAHLLGNVARASHGATVPDEVLGDGQPSEAFQTFALRKTPVTHRASSGPDGDGSSLVLTVNGVAWTEKETLYDHGPTETVFTTWLDDEQVTHVRLGDGRMGARPPAGSGNIVAAYRQGLGLAGMVGAGSLSNALDKPKGLKAVTNPLPGEGGADPEAIEDARQNAPNTVRTFGRAVSLRDLEHLARSDGAVAKAQATWLWSRAQRVAHLTVAGQLGTVFSAEGLAQLHASLSAARDRHRPLQVANYVPVSVQVSARLTVDAAYAAADVLDAAREALLAALSFEAQPLGRPVHLSHVFAVLQAVAGVVAVDVDRLGFRQPAGLPPAEWDAWLTGRGVTRGPDDRPEPVQGHLRILPARPGPPGGPSVLPAELARIEVPAQDLVLTASGGRAG